MFTTSLAQHSEATTCFDQYSACLLITEYEAIVKYCPANYLNAMNSDVLNSKDLHEITQLTAMGLSLTIEAIRPMLLRRYFIIWHRLSSLDTSPRKHKSDWEWANPSIVSHWAGAKALLEAIFRDRAKDEFLKTRVRMINPYTARQARNNTLVTVNLQKWR